MGRRVTTHFNPSLGVKYYVLDSETNQEVLGKVLGPNDKKYYPIRSKRKCKPGEEFFKMIINNEVHVFKNSINFPDCRSENGRYVFIGKRFDGIINSRKNYSKNILNAEQNENITLNTEWVDSEIKEILQKGEI
ncbi:MAG: hypothetical protein NZZ41_04795 [Candidatus Dojkabacteria bacterium]|nr:hypothetical protein [Candidatus Dojkabacteria bacterium]